MAGFYVAVSKEGMAMQIAALINTHNKLYRKHSTWSVLNDKANYFVEVMSSRVVGCVGTVKRYSTLSEVKHVCVDPGYRKQGIARRLVELAITNCETEYVYMTIRDDNIPSLKMAESLGFVPVRKHWSVDHYVITVGRKRKHECIASSESGCN